VGSVLNFPSARVIIELTAEPELMPVHVDAAAAKGNAFHRKPQPLFECVLAPHANSSAGAQHAVPRQAAVSMQGPSHLPRRSRKSGSRGDLSIAGDFASRNLPNRCREDRQRIAFLFPRSHQASLQDNCSYIFVTGSLAAPYAILLAKGRTNHNGRPDAISSL
jgi:hypothetical protein